jgi:hypothetical protein
MVKGRNSRVIGVRISDDFYNKILNDLQEGESAGSWVKRVVEQRLTEKIGSVVVEDGEGNEVVVPVKLHPVVYARLRERLHRKSKVISVARYCRELIERDQGFRD